VPALVRLLQAYLARAPAEVVAAGHLQGVLGVFQKLNASKAHDHEGFFILNALVEFLPPPAWAEHLPTVWSLLLQRLQSSRTQKYTRSFTVFLALLLAKQGPAWVAAGLDGVQAGLFAMLVEQVWLTGLAAVAGDTERKLAAVAATKLLTEFPPLASDAAAVLWGRLLEAAVVLLVDEAEEAQPGDAEEEEGRLPTAAAGGTPAFARLASAARPETQPVPEVRDARKFLAASIARMAAAQPGRLAPRIAAMLGQASQAALAQMCVEAGVAVV
jgi:exportin-2 (importin alpha re-exporter)